MKQKAWVGAVAFCLWLVFSLPAAAGPRRVNVSELLANKKAFEGKVISVDGFVRFDRLSQRGFLNRDLLDMRNRSYRQTIFLELGNENYASMKIPDGSRVLVTGYLSKELRGPLGVYAGHIIVNQIQPLKGTSTGEHKTDR